MNIKFKRDIKFNSTELQISITHLTLSVNHLHTTWKLKSQPSKSEENSCHFWKNKDLLAELDYTNMF